MPRRKVSEQNRRRITKACLYCQTSKQKCDGLLPCGQCTRRDRATACNYSPYERSYGRQRSREKKRSLEAADPPGLSKNEIDLDPGVTRIAIPKLPHDFYDTKGKPGMRKIHLCSPFEYMACLILPCF